MTPRRASTIDYVPVTVRFPRPLYERLKRLAETNKRSFNQQVVYLLQQQEKDKEGKE
jgi:hypothetical protein